MSLDIEKLRSETPGVANRVHLNNAGAGLMPRPVLDAMVGHLTREAEIGGYEAASEAAADLEGVYDSVARLLGSGRDEIALTENATVAWQLAFYSQTFRPGDRILTARAEYAANYVAFLQMAKRTGAMIEVIPDDGNGVLDQDALDRMIDDRVRLIAITWIPTNGGLRNPAAAVGRIARKHGVRYLLDACQAVGQMPTRLEELGCDFLTATGRKFLRGPRGTGFLYVRRDLMLGLEPPMIDHFGAPWVAPDRYELRRDARRFETWENNYAARLGLGRAIEYALNLGLGKIEERCRTLSAQLRDGLRTIPGVTVQDLGQNPASIVTFSIKDHDAESVRATLSHSGFNVSVSYPSSTLLDAQARHLPALIRASPHYYNTEDEVCRFIAAMSKAVDA
ncbi:aminotransferase class V-fold PLP-dependent enzyme [Rubellimicrobium roseum]|uniref:Aminotransferase class V-fold PLP-dependent enzyme n=1 Tax=Rubellimicrobium roseum TaxID=687525 RepID=A0A5C4NBR0_9RHOB|nr:aminotransferase class V-fold PLP-dependent enzyme [Rubellimicrobium roseum]TNC67208.1 aminotransferase class V-fold PLP-dependent enzyme [Rubellimicrobium roseum]